MAGQGGDQESQLAGALLGGLFGGFGAFFGAREQKKAFRRFRRRQSQALQETRQFADERVQQLTGEGSLIGRGIKFLEGTFDDPEGSPLADSLRKSIRVAQESRGLRRSPVAAVAEARALGAFSQNLRQQLLPSLLAFGTAPENLRQSIIGFEAPLRIGEATGLNITGLAPAPGLQAGFAGGGSTSSILSGIASGFIGGGQIGTAFGQQQQNSAFVNQQSSLLNAQLQQLILQSRSGGDVVV